MSHTPGPMHAHKAGDSEHQIHAAYVRNGVEHHHAVANMVPLNRQYQTDAHPQEELETAYLFAAAPELLAACEGAMRIVDLWCSRQCTNPEFSIEDEALFLMKTKLLEAIEKAKG